MTEKLFVYGLLKSYTIQQHLFQRSVKQEPYRIFGYSLLKKSVNDLYDNIYPDCDASVNGVLLHLSEQDLEMTDRFENVVNGLYKRIRYETFGFESLNTKYSHKNISESPESIWVYVHEETAKEYKNRCIS
jgi:gamma-glutamylcyclotransferase (GGCT)/AIG2-like uncharacterized protein YtfP